MALAPTESSSALTASLDQCSPAELVGLLREANQSEMFRHLGEDSLCATLGRVGSTIRQEPDTVLVLSGCGTSGRIAMFCSRAWGERVRYCIAGGDSALMEPVENAEDDAVRGENDLKTVCGNAARVVLVAITCGLSAPYVAGQLDYALNHRSIFVQVVLLGFNPIENARNVPIEGWGDGTRTFLQVARRMAQPEGGGIIINPWIGPEPITGSTRMKGGTATKILLECIWHDGPVAPLVEQYRVACNEAYLGRETCIGEWIESAAHALAADRSIVYVSSHPLAGMLGLIDASECPPTFGARPTDVVASVDGGVKGVRNVDAAAHYRPRAGDCVFVLAMQNGDQRLSSRNAELMHQATQAGARAYLVGPFSESGLGQIQLKLTLNAISTGAFVLFGKVYGNRMVDVRLSNNKLYHRAIGIVRDIAHVSESAAKHALWRALYRTDTPHGINDDTPVSAHVAQAARVNRVVPIAILLATGAVSTVDDALARIAKTPKIRDCF